MANAAWMRSEIKDNFKLNLVRELSSRTVCGYASISVSVAREQRSKEMEKCTVERAREERVVSGWYARWHKSLSSRMSEGTDVHLLASSKISARR